jgi:hypothetical protein
MLNIETTEALPPVRRGGGRPSAERKQIQDAISTLETQVIRDVEFGNKYNALQQRIRQAAASMNLKVKIVYRKHEDNEAVGDLYFVGINDESSDSEKIVDESKSKTVRRTIKPKVEA